MELSLTKIVILAVVQGMTEFLPVSSSGHLVILAGLMAPGGSVEDFDVSDVNIVLHGGTLLSILAFYLHRVWKLVREDRKLISLLAVATIPVVVVGLGVKATSAETILSDPLLAGCLLPVTGLILIWASRYATAEGEAGELTHLKAALIGAGQALAILPGLSRSGTTIAAGLRLGLSPTSAATFSFLMAIPVIGGACLLETIELSRHAVTSSSLNNAGHLANLTIGAFVAFAVGFASLWLLVRWLERGKFQHFAWWCIPLGMGVVVWQLVG